MEKKQIARKQTDKKLTKGKKLERIKPLSVSIAYEPIQYQYYTW